MAAGALDANGIWLYGEDDPASPFSDLLNLGQDSTSDAIGALKSRASAIEAQQTAERAAWTAFTPTLTALTTNPTLGTGAVAEGRYRQTGKTVELIFNITFGTTGMAAGTGSYLVSLPVAARAASPQTWPYGTIWLYDASTPLNQIGVGYYYDSTHIAIRAHGSGSAAGNATPWVWAASDGIRGQLTYETA